MSGTFSPAFANNGLRYISKSISPSLNANGFLKFISMISSSFFSFFFFFYIFKSTPPFFSHQAGPLSFKNKTHNIRHMIALPFYSFIMYICFWLRLRRWFILFPEKFLLSSEFIQQSLSFCFFHFSLSSSFFSSASFFIIHPSNDLHIVSCSRSLQHNHVFLGEKII